MAAGMQLPGNGETIGLQQQVARLQAARLQAARLRVGRLPAVAGMAAAMLVHRTPLILSRMSPSVARVAVV